ncbi:MAG TPA: DoxX family protein [Micropepsaceae bacterium]|nr:DoxX family protein [Micropepsaceae bacterium]
MHGISNYSILALTLAALFSVIGLVHLSGPRFLREAYEGWGYSQRFRLIVGLLEIIAAHWLADPTLRLSGIGLAAAINFGAVVTLLSHRQYLHAGPTIVLMIALLPATLAVPRPQTIRFIDTAQDNPSPREPSLDAVRYAAKD